MTKIPASPKGAAVRPRTRIQRAKREAILEAGLDVFSAEGFRGATLDRIARAAGLSKPNLLYYYPSKEAIHEALLRGLLDTWLAPLGAMDPHGDPLQEILRYVQGKLALSRDYPRESRLFANEILRGAPNMMPMLQTDLREMVHDHAAIIRGWIDAGRIAPVDPVHLIFSIWALTQHYADFEAQVRAVMGEDHDPFPGAAAHLDTLFRRLLSPV
jgi:TetR/AcrR family transcriptional regulator